MSARISSLFNLRRGERAPVLDAALLPAGPEYAGRVRAVLDMASAEDAFGWLLFWTDDWSATSEWFAWTLQR